MKLNSLFQGAIVALAAVGMVLPAPQLHAAAAATTKVVQVEASVFDIGLKSDGAFTGRVVDHTGAAAPKAEIVVRQGQQVVAKTSTDAEGRFAVDGLKGGVYEVASGKTVGTYRVWNETAAPPSAKEQALLVLGENGTRGQFGAASPGAILIAAVAIAALVISIVALDEAKDSSTP
jgi:hypothetical protein